MCTMQVRAYTTTPSAWKQAFVMWDSKGVSLHSPSAAAKQFFFYQFQVSEERKPQIDRKEWRGARNRKHAVVWRWFLVCLNMPSFTMLVKYRDRRAVSSTMV